MKKTAYSNNDLKERLDRLTSEINQLKSILVYQAQPGRDRSATVWKDLMKASEDISSLWAGQSALEEIQTQRGL